MYKMRWLVRILYSFLFATIFSAMLHVLPVAFGDGRGLGDHVWGAALIQVIIFSLWGFIPGILVILLAGFVLEKYFYTLKILLLGYFCISFFILSAVYVWIWGNTGINGFVPPLFGALTFCIFQYLANRPTDR